MGHETKMLATEIIEVLESMENPHNKSGMARFGINTERAFGISMKDLHPIAKAIKKNHELAIDLWETGFHEARILAVLIAEPKLLTSELMDKWALDFNSWDLCDQACGKLFCKSPLAWEKVNQWYEREEEFVKRASFALMAALAVHSPIKTNEPFLNLLEMIAAAPCDERNFVKKAVNWALRQIGKRNMILRDAAVQACREIGKNFDGSKAARWIIHDALREFDNEKTFARTAKSRHN